MLVTTVPLLAVIVGALVWLLVRDPRFAEMGKWLFVVGLFWLIAGLAHASVRF